MHLNAETAKMFIGRFSKSTDYNVNIMNDKGIIIASKDPKRIGSFHETAFDILSNGKDSIEIFEEEKYLGVMPGVNLPIRLKGENVGVIGVTGHPEEVRQVALLIKMSMETMLEYEIQKEKLLRHRTMKEKLLYDLIYDTDPNDREMLSLAKNLGYDEKYLRIPILILKKEDFDTEELLKKLKRGDTHTSQDMSIITRENNILVFKVLKKSPDLLSEYKEHIIEYISPILQYDEKGYKIYVGTFQDRYANYHSAYDHCIWLVKHMTEIHEPIFFYDYVDEYLAETIPTIELHKIFNTFGKFLSGDFVKTYQDTIKILKESDYNLTVASDKMFVHKNTLVFRLDKIKNAFNLNPLKSARAKHFIESLYYYWNRL